MVAVASSTAPGVLDTKIPRSSEQATQARRSTNVLTLRFAGGNIDLVIAGAVVRYPLDAGCQGGDDLLVEDANLICGDVVSVDTNDSFIFSARLEVLEEVGPVWRVHRLKSTKS